MCVWLLLRTWQGKLTEADMERMRREAAKKRGKTAAFGHAARVEKKASQACNAAGPPEAALVCSLIARDQ